MLGTNKLFYTNLPSCFHRYAYFTATSFDGNFTTARKPVIAYLSYVAFYSLYTSFYTYEACPKAMVLCQRCLLPMLLVKLAGSAI